MIFYPYLAESFLTQNIIEDHNSLASDGRGEDQIWCGIDVGGS